MRLFKCPQCGWAGTKKQWNSGAVSRLPKRMTITMEDICHHDEEDMLYVVGDKTVYVVIGGNRPSRIPLSQYPEPL